jgi:hypothetical protein
MPLVLLLAAAASADPVIEVGPTVVKFGAQPFGSTTVRDFGVRNVTAFPIWVEIDAIAVGDDFSPGQIQSSCGLGRRKELAPGESCHHVVSFSPSTFFQGRQEALLRVTATEIDEDPVQQVDVVLTGRGFTAGPRMIDFTEPGEGVFDPTYFAIDGVRFTDGESVGFVAGDHALIGPVAFDVLGGPNHIWVSFAPVTQGTAEYHLIALDKDGVEVARSERVVVQDEGDPETGPFGYEVIELLDLPASTRSFRVENEFVSSTFGGDEIGFGVSRIVIR